MEGDDSEYDAFEYFRYHSVAMNTFMNKNGMFYGTAGLLKSESSNFYKYYSQNGYVTLVCKKLNSFQQQKQFKKMISKIKLKIILKLYENLMEFTVDCEIRTPAYFIRILALKDQSFKG